MAEHRSVIGGTRAGKTFLMAKALADYAEDHPLGSARQWGGMILLEPGPDVVKGEVISRAREVEAGDGDEC